jgi:hypothetical protein
MPEIIVTAAGDPTPERGDIEVTLRERINVADFESERFAANLVERIEWAVSDAVELERRGRITGRPMPPRTSRPEQAPAPEHPEHPREPAWA